MDQETFVRRAEERWRSFAVALDQLSGSARRGGADFPRLYRSICHDLALARERQFDAHLVDRLNSLALRGHQQLYRPVTPSWQRMVGFWARDLPRSVWREAPFVLVAGLIFYGAGLLLAGLVQLYPDLVHAVLDPGEVASLEAMYDPSSPHHLRPRGADTDAAMFGFYIRNNIGIGFRTFAGGIFLGLGSLFFLVFNGVVLGVVGGHLVQIGFGETFGSFVVGHGALELQAIVLAAAAGLRLGWPLLSPGAARRIDALRGGASAAVPLLYGATTLFFLAAGVEAFWSASVLVPARIKFIVGGVLWVITALYFATARRRDGP